MVQNFKLQLPTARKYSYVKFLRIILGREGGSMKINIEYDVISY